MSRPTRAEMLELAATAARSAEGHAREYREEAAALRDGRIPGEDW